MTKAAREADPASPDARYRQELNALHGQALRENAPHRTRAEDWVHECLSFGPGGGFLYLADLGPHDFLYLVPASDRESQP